MIRMPRRLALIALALSMALVAAACGDDDDDDDAGTVETTAPSGETTVAGATTAPPTGNAGVEAATAFIQPFLVNPTKIQIAEPLPATPDKGVKVFWAECNFPVCASIGDGLQAASDILGWELTRVPYNPGNQDEVGAVMQQGVDSGADVLMITGRPLSEFQDAAAAAVAKGIPIIDGYTVNPPLGEENGIYACIGCSADSQLTIEMMTNWVIADSGGTANIIYSTIPDFPIIAFRDAVIKDTLAKNCPDCKLTVLNNSIQDLLEGAIPGKIVSALQADPTANYVFFAFGDQAFGTAVALEEAGIDLSKVKVMGHDPNIESLNNVKAGKEWAWGGNAVIPVGYYFADTYARIRAGVDFNPLQPIETQILFTGSPGLDAALQLNADTGTSAPYVGVLTYEADFKSLWNITG